MISYTLKRNRRSRHLRLAVGVDCKVTVTAPHFANTKIIENFITEKSEWIQGRIDHYKTFTPLIQDSRASYMEHKELARIVAHKKVSQFNEFYNFAYNKISIKNQKTCWGSCSKKGNLNFNYKIALLPEELADYVVVHEICHLKEFNHSKSFWDLVSQTIPDYMKKRKALSKVGVIAGIKY